MKKGFLAALLFLLIFILPLAYSLNLGTVKGYVRNGSGVIEPGSTVALTIVGCSGSGCTASGTTDTNGFYIKTNLNLVPGNNVSVTATKGSASGTKSRLASGSGSVGVAAVNITMCTPPPTPNLNAVPDGHSNSVISMSWTTFAGIGDHDEFVFDSNAANTSAHSPQKRYNVSFNSHTWKVRTCNSACCSNYATDTFVITNSAPPAPNLTDQPHTQSTSLSFKWINYSDPDGDFTKNKFQLSTDSNFATIVQNSSNASSPFSVSGLTTFTLYFWRVRTCDLFGSCGPYNNDTFFVYNCPGSSTTIINEGGGGHKTKYVNVTNNVTNSCIPSWECKDWGICSANGLSTRSCVDANNCVNNIPVDFQSCSYQGQLPQQNNAEKTGGAPPEERLPLSTNLFYKNLLDLGLGLSLDWVLLLIIISLIIIIIHQHEKYVVREIKIDKKLTEYVISALNKGFNESQIKSKLLEDGVAVEEIEYVFNFINKKKSSNHK